MDTKILLCGMPPLMHELVGIAVARRPGAIVVDTGASPDSAGQIVAAVLRTRAEVVVLSTSCHAFGEVLHRLLAQRPPVHLLIVAHDGRETFHCRPLGERSAQEMLDALGENRA